MIAFTIRDQDMSRKLGSLLAQVQNPADLLMVIGREAVNRLKKHYRLKDAREPNRLGGARTHFWLEVSRAVQSPVTRGKRVTVTINHPSIAQKVKGGIISAKRTRMLTIPVAPEAHGRTARTTEQELGVQIFLINAGRGKGLAAEIEGQVKLLYILKPSVKQEADPTALPEEKEFTAGLIRRAEIATARMVHNAGLS